MYEFDIDKNFAKYTWGVPLKKKPTKNNKRFF